MGTPGRGRGPWECADASDLARLCDKHGAADPMTESDMGHTEGAKEAELSRQDWRMLPLLSLLTIVVIANAMSITARLIARQAHFEASGSMLPCLVLGDLST